jgi:hypothetical protein
MQQEDLGTLSIIINILYVISRENFWESRSKEKGGHPNQNAHVLCKHLWLAEFCSWFENVMSISLCLQPIIFPPTGASHWVHSQETDVISTK